MEISDLMDEIWQNGGSWVYRISVVIALLGGAVMWYRGRNDSSGGMVYLAAVIGAFVGAKLSYLMSEGWLISADDPHRVLTLLSGKSVTGALLGGYAAVELAKSAFGIRSATGDRFAVITPLAVALGRVGCMVQGCCAGKLLHFPWGWAHWPAPYVESGFNLLMAGVLLQMRRRGMFKDQLFHLYLMAYGSFRFLHEFLRATPKIAGGLSGYQFWALLLSAFGYWAYRKRRRERLTLEL